jgi:hypothetical protein
MSFIQDREINIDTANGIFTGLSMKTSNKPDVV